MTPPEPLQSIEESELLEEVDAQGNSTGLRLPRDEMHRRGLLHRTSTAILFTDETRTKMWLQTRSRFINNPLKKGLTGGHASPGDTPVQTIEREFREELVSGGDIPTSIVFRELFTVIKNYPRDHIMVTVFEAMYAGPFDPKKLNKQEVESIDEYDTETVLREVDTQPEKFAGGTLTLLTRYKAEIWPTLSKK